MCHHYFWLIRNNSPTIEAQPPYHDCIPLYVNPLHFSFSFEDNIMRRSVKTRIGGGSLPYAGYEIIALKVRPPSPTTQYPLIYSIHLSTYATLSISICIALTLWTASNYLLHWPVITWSHALGHFIFHSNVPHWHYLSLARSRSLLRRQCHSSSSIKAQSYYGHLSWGAHACLAGTSNLNDSGSSHELS